MKPTEPTPKVNQEIIRQLLEYSFKDRGDTIPYINLTVREKSIVTKSEYEKVIEFIDGVRDIDGEERMTMKDLIILYAIAITIGTVLGKIIWHYLFSTIF